MAANQLVGMSEIAQIAGVTKQAVANWRDRNVDFPKPVANLKQGPVWELNEIAVWAKGKDIQIDAVEAEAINDKDRASRALTVALLNMKGGVGKSTLTAN